MEKEPKRVNPLDKIALYLGTTSCDGTITIPPALGSGYIKGFPIGDYAAVIYCDYRLHEPLELKSEQIDNEQITDKPESFRGASPFLLFQFCGCLSDELDSFSNRTVQISTMNINMEENLLSQPRRADLFLTINSAQLKEVIDCTESPVLQSILNNECPLFFESSITKDIQTTIARLIACDVSPALRFYYLKNKVDELICTLLIELSERKIRKMYPISAIDLAKIYSVRNNMLCDFSTVPNIKQIAQSIGMSESKLSKLFKQVFGDSLFNYFEVKRIEHAAAELRQGQKTVSEVGYSHGFSNLSHFTRLFERIIGHKPKAYSKKVSRQ